MLKKLEDDRTKVILSPSGMLILPLLTLLIFATLSVFVVNVAWSKGQKSTKSICVKCHQSIGTLFEKKVQHKPFRQGKCTECHSPHAAKFSKLLVKKAGKLCLKCHKPFTGAVVHKPIEEGGCLSCHNPHASSSNGLLKTSSGKSCLECHEKKDFTEKKNIHPLVKKLNCTKCHDPHSSKRDGLLLKSRKSICIGCHDPKKSNLKASHRGFSVTGSDCIGCHNPHGSDNKKILQTILHSPFEKGDCKSCHISGSKKVKDNTVNLCLQCHEQTLDTFNKPKNHLISGKGENFCLNCHNPHGANKKSMLKGRDHTICYSCHLDSEHIAKVSRFRHPGLKKCTDCHVAHSSTDRFMLKDGGTGTCSTLECHQSQGAFTHPVGEGVIDHRTNKEMDCATCHSVMGSDFKPILRGDKDRGLCIECHSL